MRMPVKAAPAPIVTVFSWTGCYIGGHVGYAWGKKRVDPVDSGRRTQPTSITTLTASLPAARSAAISGSATVGCSASKARPLGLTWTAGRTTTIPSAPNGFRTEADIIGSIAARLGYAFGATGQTLVFVKGGAAFIHEQFFATASSRSTFSSDKDLRWGWMVGGGLEQALTSNWSFKAEYNYSNFGTDDVDLSRGSACDDYDDQAARPSGEVRHQLPLRRGPGRRPLLTTASA